MNDSKHCQICRVELTNEGLTADCGGDCTLCMALSGDPDCMYTVIPLLLEDRERLRQQLAEAEALRVCADHDANELARQLVKCQAGLVRTKLEIIEMVRDRENKYGIGSMTSQWTAEDIADDLLRRINRK